MKERRRADGATGMAGLGSPKDRTEQEGKRKAYAAEGLGRLGGEIRGG